MRTIPRTGVVDRAMGGQTNLAVGYPWGYRGGSLARVRGRLSVLVYMYGCLARFGWFGQRNLGPLTWCYARNPKLGVAFVVGGVLSDGRSTEDSGSRETTGSTLGEAIVRSTLVTGWRSVGRQSSGRGARCGKYLRILSTACIVGEGADAAFDA